MTGRSLNANISSAINSAALMPFFAVDLLFDSPNQIYLWSGAGDLTIDGQVYTGGGELLQISEIRESSDIAAYGATLTLSGIPSTLIALAKDEPYQGRKALLKFGVIVPASNDFLLLESGDFLLLESGDKILLENGGGAGGVLTPFFTTVFSGEMDQMNFTIGPETSSISLEVESRLVDLRNPRLRRYSHADQQAKYSGDKFFEFTARLQNERLEWGG